MADAWIEAIGLVGGLIGILAWIPQIRRVWVDGKEEGISIPTFVAVSVSLSLWLVYGIIVNSIAMIVSNILTLAFIVGITVGVYRIRSKQSLPWRSLAHSFRVDKRLHWGYEKRSVDCVLPNASTNSSNHLVDHCLR